MFFRSICIFVILLTKCCSAKVQLVKEVIGTEVDLENHLKCPQGWKEMSGNKDAGMPIKIDDQNKEDAYECQSSKDEVIVVRYEKMYFQPTPLVGIITNDNVSLDCYASYTSASFDIVSTLTITDKDGKEIAKGEITKVEELDRIYITSEGVVNLAEPGQFVYNCVWDITATYKKETYKDKMTMNVSIRVNKPVSNTHPDKFEAKVDETITCLADGDPAPINFEWRCVTGTLDDYEYEITDEGWTYDKKTLQLKYPWKFNCSCVASSEVNGRVFHSSWNGTISCLNEEGKVEERKRKVGVTRTTKADSGSDKTKVGSVDEVVSKTTKFGKDPVVGSACRVSFGISIFMPYMVPCFKMVDA